MRFALVDNGSLEPAAHAGLRAAAARLSQRAGVHVEAVSWRHSDRIPAAALGGEAASTLAPWIRARLADGEREFLIVPFLVSPEGAIAARLRRDLDALRAGGDTFDYQIAGGLAAGTDLASIVADRVRATLAQSGLRRAAVVVVDHGGPSRESVAVRNRVAAEAARALADVGPVAAASMEVPDGPDAGVHGPLLAAVLASPGFAAGHVVIAPLFLLPGRHAGPEGDLARIARAAQARSPSLRCHFTELVGSHPRATEALSAALSEALAPGVQR